MSNSVIKADNIIKIRQELCLLVGVSVRQKRAGYTDFLENGAGKSTLMNIITNRVFKHWAGVLFDGEDLENDKALNRIYARARASQCRQVWTL